MAGRIVANPEHLKILRQGVKSWNVWREKDPGNRPDLSGAKLSGANLMAANFRGVDFSGADLSNAVLRGANLYDANLVAADLTRADLSVADLRAADFRNANLRETQFYFTVVGFCYIWYAEGLDLINHQGPSVLGVDVLRESQGKLPTAFLEGCGFAEWEIEAARLYDPALTEDERSAIAYEILRLQGEQPIQMHPLFISYSHRDLAFVGRLESNFKKLGVRYWRDTHDLKAGRVETQIDRAIRLNPTVLLDFSSWRDTETFEIQFAKLLDGLKLFYKPRSS